MNKSNTYWVVTNPLLQMGSSSTGLQRPPPIRSAKGSAALSKNALAEGRNQVCCNNPLNPLQCVPFFASKNASKRCRFDILYLDLLSLSFSQLLPLSFTVGVPSPPLTRSGDCECGCPNFWTTRGSNHARFNLNPGWPSSQNKICWTDLQILTVGGAFNAPYIQELTLFSSLGLDLKQQFAVLSNSFPPLPSYDKWLVAMMRYGCLVVLEVMLISYATTFMLGKPMVVTCPSVSTLKIKSYQYFKRDTSIYCLSAISITTLCQSKLYDLTFFVENLFPSSIDLLSIAIDNLKFNRKSQLPLEVCRRLFTFVVCSKNVMEILEAELRECASNLSLPLVEGEFISVTLVQLNKSYIDICKSTLIPLVEILEFSSMCKVLNDQGLFNLGQSRIDKSKRVTLQVLGLQPYVIWLDINSVAKSYKEV
ncbi:Cdc6 [Theobroma cacao]|nr:Cdc6 [Theobroma cacao]